MLSCIVFSFVSVVCLMSEYDRIYHTFSSKVSAFHFDGLFDVQI